MFTLRLSWWAPGGWFQPVVAHCACFFIVVSLKGSCCPLVVHLTKVVEVQGIWPPLSDSQKVFQQQGLDTGLHVHLFHILTTWSHSPIWEANFLMLFRYLVFFNLLSYPLVLTSVSVRRSSLPTF